MDKNIVYLKKIIEDAINIEIDVNFIKNYLSIYLDKYYLDDSSFLKSIDVFDITSHKHELNENFDYKKYLNFKILDGACVFVFLNGNFLLSDFLKDGIKLSVYDKNINAITAKFNDKNILNNLNIFLIFNLFFYKSFNYFSISDFVFSDTPIYILNFFNNDFESSSCSPRFFLDVGCNVKLNILESYFNLSDNMFINSNTSVSLKEGSQINYAFLNDSVNNTLGAHSFYSKLYKNSSLVYNNYIFNSKHFKNNCYFFLLDDFCQLKSNFSRSLKFNFIDDVVLKVFHSGNKSFSRSNFRSVVSGKSTCNFYGFIDVDFDVLNVDSGLMCKSLLLDMSSSVKMIPELSIKNNDVKCFHGAVIGFLNEDLFFYIMSRGFSKEECITLLINSFLHDVVYDDSMYCFNIFEFLFNKYYMY